MTGGRLRMPNPESQEEQFMELVAKHQQQVFGYIYALVQNFQDAQDVYQQTLMVLWRKFGQYRPGTNFLAWATKTAQLECYAFRRSTFPRSVSLSLEAMRKVADSQTRQARVAAAESDHLQALLQKCIEKLSAPDQDLLKQCYQIHCRIKDVAAALGRSPQSVCNSLGRIRRDLHKCIEISEREERDP